MQQLGFGTHQDTVTLVRCLEAIFFLMLGDTPSAELLKWTETTTEAFFLQLSVFGSQNPSEQSSAMVAELEYAEELIERI